MKNPFVFGEIVGASELVDRRDELKSVEAALSGGEKLWLIGPRRFGKSSILRAARENLATGGATVLLFNVEAFSDLNALSQAIVVASAKATQGSLQSVGEVIRGVFSRLRPELSYDIASGSWSASLGVAGGIEGGAATLVEALNGLEALAASQNRVLGLALDEFQRVIELGGAASEAQIRAAIQNHSHVGYALAGSKTRLLSDMISNAERPFYRLGSALFLGEIPRADFRIFLRHRFEQSSFSIDEDAIEAILERAADVPYNVQLLAHATWNAALETRAADVATVAEALDKLIAQNDPFYSQLWLLLSPVQSRVLQFVLRNPDKPPQGAEATRRIGKNPATIQKSLLALQDKDVLRLETRGDAANYRLEDPFFGAWIEATIAPL